MLSQSGRIFEIIWFKSEGTVLLHGPDDLRQISRKDDHEAMVLSKTDILVNLFNNLKAMSRRKLPMSVKSFGRFCPCRSVVYIKYTPSLHEQKQLKRFDSGFNISF